MSLTLPSCFFPGVGEFFPGEGGVAPAELLLDAAPHAVRITIQWYSTSCTTVMRELVRLGYLPVGTSRDFLYLEPDGRWNLYSDSTGY
jgi:hypothetical protein